MSSGQLFSLDHQLAGHKSPEKKIPCSKFSKYVWAPSMLELDHPPHLGLTSTTQRIMSHAAHQSLNASVMSHVTGLGMTWHDFVLAPTNPVCCAILWIMIRSHGGTLTCSNILYKKHVGCNLVLHASRHLRLGRAKLPVALRNVWFFL